MAAVTVFGSLEESFNFVEFSKEGLNKCVVNGVAVALLFNQRVVVLDTSFDL